MREGIFFFWGGGGQHACGFLFSFSKVTENAIITIKLFILFLQKSGGGGGAKAPPSPSLCAVPGTLMLRNY